MQIIILTGTIGSGKSTVAAILKKLGAAVVDSDDMARHAVDAGCPAFQEALEYFGNEILDEAGGIDRKKLAARVFNHPADLARLNQIIHPRVDDKVEAVFEQSERAGKKVVFVEMAFLAGPRWEERVNAVWVVRAAREIALKRLEARGVSRSEALLRLANQSDPAAQATHPVRFIDNDGNPQELEIQVAKLWNKLDNRDG